MFTFPRIKTRRSARIQAEKVAFETLEFRHARSEREKDKEALDVLQAAETLVRLHFRGKMWQLEKAVKAVTRKNRHRGYYTKGCF
jgi:hypothetical protein